MMVLFNFINPLYYALAWTVIHSVWQVFIIALASGLLHTLLRNHKANIRYNALIFSMVLIIVSSIVTFSYYYNLSPEEMVSVETILLNNEESIATQNLFTVGETTQQSIWSIEKFSAFVNNNIYIIVMLWLAGMVLAMLRLLGNISYVYYLKNNMNFPVDEYWQKTLDNISSKINLKKTVEIFESALVRSPIVLGHLKPIIFFPIGAINRLSVEEVEAILAHELAHISRNDYLMNIIINVIESLYFFNPAMWWLSSQIKTEREHCCDDIAINFTGSPLKYAKSLVAVQEMAMYSPRLAMAFANGQKKNELLVRVNRLVKNKSRAFNIREKGIASVIVCGLVILIFLAAKPVDNANHCLPTAPENPGLPTFLKFTHSNKLDSLKIDFEVNDGDYDYNDYIHEVKMKIVNRHVVSFNLNGIEIAGRDISKFENLIEQILIEKTVTPEEPMSDLGELNTDIEMSIYDEFTETLKNDKLLRKENINHINFNYKNMMINEKIMSENIHQKYSKIFKEMNGGKLDGDSGFSFTVVLDENGVIIQENSIGVTVPPAPEDSENSNQSSYSYSYSTSDIENDRESYQEEKFKIWLEKELLKDGYLLDPAGYSLLWNSKTFIIDNIEVDAEDVKKYAKKREEMTGLKITSTFMITRNVTK